MARGRQKGQTKIMSKIKDPILGPYELWLEEDQIVLVNTDKDKPISYHGNLETAVKRISFAAKSLPTVNPTSPEPESKVWLLTATF